jgi:hypothetical protein
MMDSPIIKYKHEYKPVKTNRITSDGKGVEVESVRDMGYGEVGK